jgi:hypothetical protein
MEEVSKIRKLGRKTILTFEEEELLANWVLEVSDTTFSWNSQQVKDAARIIVQCREDAEKPLPVFSDT